LEGDRGIRFEPEEVEIEFVDEATGAEIVPLSVEAALEAASGASNETGRRDEVFELSQGEYEVGSGVFDTHAIV
jgi:hypothetical protein